jgi:transposase InsO family protein
VRTRKELAEGGLDCGAASIKDALGDRAPSEATIWRVLKRRGQIVPEPHKAPKWSGRRFVAERANECWQIDATHWALSSGEGVEIVNVIDDCSRLCVASIAVPVCTTANAFAAVVAGAERFGWPERVLSDNGSAFRGSPAQQTVGGLAAALTELGVATSRSRPFHPQTCGKVERFHQTVKRRLTALDLPADLSELQHQLDEFTDHYNRRRRHRGIGRRIPFDVFTATPKSGPATHALRADTVIFRTTGHQGTVTISGRIRIAIGARYNGQLATIVKTGPNCHVFIDGRLIRHLTINPARAYQALRQQTAAP